MVLLKFLSMAYILSLLTAIIACDRFMKAFSVPDKHDTVTPQDVKIMQWCLATCLWLGLIMSIFIIL